VITSGDTYIGRVAARNPSEWHSAFRSTPLSRNRCHSSLVCVLGENSALHFEITKVDWQVGLGCDFMEVRQYLDLSETSVSARVRLYLRSGYLTSNVGTIGVSGYHRFGEYRFTLIRYSALTMARQVRLGDLFDLDCSQLFDAYGLPVAADSLMLLKACGHGTSGSIQLVSRSLGLRLLKSYPSIYST